MLKSAFSVFLFCLLRRLDCTVSQHASEVQVYEGAESVLLPCQVPADVSSDSTAVVWNRDEFTIPMVHKRVQSSDELTNQNLRYLGRTSMRATALQTGDLSLTLRNPTVSDSGTYTCTARKAGDDLKEIHVQLKVSESPPRWPIVVAFVVPVLLLAVLFGALVYRANNKVKNRAVSTLKAEKVTEGAESVQLPWNRKKDLPAAVRVKWTLKQPKHGEICECVKDQTGQWKLEPGPGYKGRVQMDQLTEGDFTLTLMRPRCDDGGVYLFVVYGQDEKPINVTIVVLWVKETWWKTITGLFERRASDPEEDMWRLSDALTEMFENTYGNEVEGENAPVMLENLDGRENAEEIHLLNGQP
ncbi:uncharacterized protein LOC102080930 isoform X2 [Oreochromis niloticus]|uniref:uncharacterized protein LOC102080930 isoform X2 n=1 Tax=Oreochromis niloticus TaxID=8128 RepID=UPI0003941CCF|nr:uncharacterized protein LOC102080930 isoform X2 [Oreochromis niloticus]